MFSEIKDIKHQAKDWGIPLWQHPQVLFALMGLLIITIDVLIYLITNAYILDFGIITIAVTSITILLLIITFVLQSSFQRMAEAHKMKSEFISIVSHQLRSPITNLRWALDTIKVENKALIESGSCKSFEALEINVQRMKELVDNLLIASRLEANRLVSNIERLDLNKIIIDNVQNLKLQAEKNQLRLNFSINNNIERIACDALQANMVVENLITNAIRYSRKGDEINIWTEVKKDKVILFVKDKGYGIPDNDKKFLFQKFFRASNVRQHLPEGSGLGLYIVSGIMRKIGGDIGYESKMGRGSIFWVGFPIAN